MQPVAEPSEKKNRWYADIRIKVAIIATLILLLAGISVSGWFLSYVLRPGPMVPVNRVTVYIPRGTSVQQIVEILAEARLIQADSRFILLTRLTGLSGQLQAGEFSLLTNQKPLGVIRELARARPLEHSITIPEGLTIKEIAVISTEQARTEAKRIKSKMTLGCDFYTEQNIQKNTPTLQEFYDEYYLPLTAYLITISYHYGAR